MDNVRRYDVDLDKYIYLAALLDRNERLFYQVTLTSCLTHTAWPQRETVLPGDTHLMSHSQCAYVMLN